MPQVIALRSFEHDRTRKKGETFEVSEQVAVQLERAGLVALAGPESDVPEHKPRQRPRRHKE